MAKQVATPMPSSAPREVPVAMSHLLSTMRGVRGSVSKLISTSSFFSTTMSMWHCRQMEGLFSRPGQERAISKSTRIRLLADQQIFSLVHVRLAV